MSIYLDKILAKIYNAFNSIKAVKRRVVKIKLIQRALVAEKRLRFSLMKKDSELRKGSSLASDNTTVASVKVARV